MKKLLILLILSALFVQCATSRGFAPGRVHKPTKQQLCKQHKTDYKISHCKKWKNHR